MNTRPLSVCLHAALVTTVCVLSACGQGENKDPTVILNPAGPEQTYVVGDTAYISVLAEDPDGDALTFEFKHRTTNTRSTIDNATFVKTATNATLSWNIDSADVTASGEPLEMIFIVKDARGAEVQRKLDVSILPGNGVPRFESSANQIYRGCCDTPLSFEVRVRDDDDSEVELKMARPIEGATFEQTGPKKGRFTWTPTTTQARQRIHAVQFVADDGKTAAVYQDATIVIFSEQDAVTPVNPTSSTVCEGENAITHIPLKSGYYNERELSIEASLADGIAKRYDTAAVSWGYRDPVSNPTISPETSEAITDDKSLLGEISNYALINGRNETIYYKICLIDSDAADEGALLCAPSTPNLYYSFLSYSSPNETCLDNSANDTAERAQNVAVDDWTAYTLCDVPDFHQVILAPGQKRSVVLSYSKGAQLTTTLYDEDNQEVPSLVKTSACTGLTTLTLEAPENSGTAYTIKIEGSEIPYHITAIDEGGAGTNDCVDADNEPNQTRAKATPLGTTQRLNDLAICPDGGDRDLYTISGLSVGQTLEVKMNHPASAGNLDLELYTPSTPDDVIGNVGAGVAFTFSIGQDDEILTHDITQCGDHTLMVFSNGSPNTYSLTTSVSQSACQDDDEFTCNHQLSNAALFAWDRTYSLKGCAKIDDWFRHKGNGAEILAEVEVTSGDVDDVKFEVYDREGNRLAESTKSNNAQELVVSFPDDEMYYFRVSSSSEVSYNLLVVQP